MIVVKKKLISINVFKPKLILFETISMLTICETVFLNFSKNSFSLLNILISLKNFNTKGPNLFMAVLYSRNLSDVLTKISFLKMNRKIRTEKMTEKITNIF